MVCRTVDFKLAIALRLIDYLFFLVLEPLNFVVVLLDFFVWGRFASALVGVREMGVV